MRTSNMNVIISHARFPNELRLLCERIVPYGFLQSVYIDLKKDHLKYLGLFGLFRSKCLQCMYIVQYTLKAHAQMPTNHAYPRAMVVP